MTSNYSLKTTVTDRLFSFHSITKVITPKGGTYYHCEQCNDASMESLKDVSKNHNISETMIKTKDLRILGEAHTEAMS